MMSFNKLEHEKNKKRLTLSMPCFGRPKRTIRAIKCIAEQNTNGWEALITGDGCGVMKDYIESDYFLDIQKDCFERGNDLIITNNKKNKGHYGFAVTNQNILNAKGRYFIFYANDDVILSNHFDNYLSEIEGSNLDFVFFNSWMNCYQLERISELKYGSIGHSELIIKTNFLRRMPEHSKRYGHDFELIENMMWKTKKYKKAKSVIESYWIMGSPLVREGD